MLLGERVRRCELTVAVLVDIVVAAGGGVVCVGIGHGQRRWWREEGKEGERGAKVFCGGSVGSRIGSAYGTDEVGSGE